MPQFLYYQTWYFRFFINFHILIFSVTHLSKIVWLYQENSFKSFQYNLAFKRSWGTVIISELHLSAQIVKNFSVLAHKIFIFFLLILICFALSLMDKGLPVSAILPAKIDTIISVDEFKSLVNLSIWSWVKIAVTLQIPSLLSFN